MYEMEIILQHCLITYFNFIASVEVTPEHALIDLIRLPSASGRALLIWEEGKSHRPLQ
jgi:hypothetical protein